MKKTLTLFILLISQFGFAAQQNVEKNEQANINTSAESKYEFTEKDFDKKCEALKVHRTLALCRILTNLTFYHNFGQYKKPSEFKDYSDMFNYFIELLKKNNCYNKVFIDRLMDITNGKLEEDKEVDEVDEDDINDSSNCVVS